MNTDSKSSRPSADFEAASKPPVVVIYGPTAVGKTAFIASLPRNSFEIINADSRQVYRYLDIGTAKPDKELLSAIPHHLIDVCDPDEQFSTGLFVRETERLVSEILGRGHYPIIAGGTGYYLRNFLFGLPTGPGAFPAIRKDIMDEMSERGIDALFHELESVDPVTAGRISRMDRYRIARALEVFRGAGIPLSEFRVPCDLRSDFRLLTIYLQRPRAELYARINERVDVMFERGLIREVCATVERDFPRDSPGLRTIGYSELLDLTRDGCRTVGDARETIKRNTRRFAKRQITFFGGLPADLSIDPDTIGGAIAFILTHCGKSAPM